MKSRTALVFASALGLMVAAGFVAQASAASGDTNTTSSNAATPATAYPGEGQSATPAMPGNPTAAAEVEQHRPTIDRGRADEPDADRPQINKPDVERPDIQKPEIEVPEVMGR